MGGGMFKISISRLSMSGSGWGCVGVSGSRQEWVGIGGTG